MAQIVYQPEVDGDRPILEQIFPDGVISTASVAVTVINKTIDATVATTTGAAVQSTVDATLWLYDTADITGLNLETVVLAQLTLVFTATLSTGGTIARRQTLVVNGAQLRQSRALYGGAVTIDTVGGTSGTAFPIGTPSSPVDNETDALTIAASIGTRTFRFRGILTLANAYTNWKFKGLEAEENSILDFNGQIMTTCMLTGLESTGALAAGSDDNEWFRCGVLAITGIENGFFNGCHVEGNLTLSATGSMKLLASQGSVPGAGFTLDMNGSSGVVIINDFAGHLTLTNVSNAGGQVEIHGIGEFTFAASCTAGTIELMGVGDLDDNSAGSTIDRKGFLSTDNFGNVTVGQYDLRQGWSRSISPTSEMEAIIHLESSGARVALPGGAALTYQGYDQDGSTIAGFSGSGTLRNAGVDAYFAITQAYTPIAGTIIIVQATITGSGVGGGTHIGQTEISFPEF